MNDRPKQFLPDTAGVGSSIASADTPIVDITPQGAEEGNGPLAGLTPNYSLNLVNFDWITWHNYEWDNWRTVDALLDLAIGFLNIVGVWRPQTDYTAGETVFDPQDLNKYWLCLVTHTSGTQFDQAEQDAYWELRQDASPPVTSVHNRIGDVVAEYGDYAAFYADKALFEAHVADTTNPHDTVWDDLLDKPSTFPPSAHTHTESEITDLDKYTQAEVNTRVTAVQTDLDAHKALTNNPHGTSWNNLLSKPSTFPPSPHDHVEADITDLDKYTKAEVDASQAAQNAVIDSNTALGNANAADIQTNTADIQTNATNIAQNTTDISTNRTDIDANTAAISTNTTDIAQNSADIAQNTSDIAQNTSDIAANATLIGDNATKNTEQDGRLDDLENGTTFDTRYVNRTGDNMTGLLSLNTSFYTELLSMTRGSTSAGFLLAQGPSFMEVRLNGDPAARIEPASAGANYALTVMTRGKADARYLQKSGGTLTGFLTLHADPTADLHAASKVYVDTGLSGKADTAHTHTENQITDLDKYTQNEVDALVTAVQTDLDTHEALTNNPHNTSWTNLIGKPTEFPPSAHTHVEADISDLDKYTQAEVDGLIATRLTQTQADARYLQLTGGTLTGKLTLDGAPTADLHAATKKYVDDNAGGGGGASVTTGPTFPTSPATGDLHYMTAEPVGLYVWYDDGDSTQWVQTNGGSTGGDYLLKSGDTMTGDLVMSGANIGWDNSVFGIERQLPADNNVINFRPDTFIGSFNSSNNIDFAAAGTLQFQTTAAFASGVTFRQDSYMVANGDLSRAMIAQTSFGNTGYTNAEHAQGLYTSMNLVTWQGFTTFRHQNDGVGYAEGGWTTYSDASVKRNVRPLRAALGKRALDAVTSVATGYYERTDRMDYDGKPISEPGLIADSLPEKIRSVFHPKGAQKPQPPGDDSPPEFYDRDHYGYNYGHVIALLMEAVKELKEEVEALRDG